MSVAKTEALIEQNLSRQPRLSPTPSVSVFLNNLTHSLSRIQRSGIAAVSERRETDTQIVLTITIPKER